MHRPHSGPTLLCVSCSFVSLGTNPSLPTYALGFVSLPPSTSCGHIGTHHATFLHARSEQHDTPHIDLYVEMTIRRLLVVGRTDGRSLCNSAKLLSNSLFIGWGRALFVDRRTRAHLAVGWMNGPQVNNCGLSDVEGGGGRQIGLSNGIG